MKKTMNLIPNDVKQKRRSKEIKKKVLMASAVPGVFFAQLLFSIYTMGNDINELQDNIQVAKGIEQQITTEQNLIQKNRFIVTNLTNGGLPLNQFLLFTGISIPEDVRLYYIGSKANMDEKEEEVDGDTAEEGNETESNAEANVAPEAPPTEQSAEGGSAESATEENVKEKSEPEVLDDRIVIQGAALNVNSIGVFMGELEKKNDYIENVDIVDVQNYYNGAFNYKLFEIILEMKK